MPVSIFKARSHLKAAYIAWKKSIPYLLPKESEEIKSLLKAFQDAILQKDLAAIKALTSSIKLIPKEKVKIPKWIKTRDFIFGLIGAIIVAFGLIRPMWFELYQIPSGSMRPTLKEMDRLTVSKTQFGINIPLTTGHFLFEPEQVKRNGICIFTGEGMDITDGKTDYFYLFKGYKQYIKRLIGKPEDTLYFYGGKIYGIDKEGNSLKEVLNPENLQAIDHIPFLNFEGIIKPKGRNNQGIFSPVFFSQSGYSLLKMQAIGSTVKSEILYTNGEPIQDYYQLFGFEHYGISRIVKKDRYYLEIVHHPSIHGAKVQQDLYGRSIPILHLSKSFLPLEDTHLKALFSHLYTARFTVKNGMMKRFSQNHPPLNETSSHIYPKFTGIPDGTYEYDNGTAYQIYPQGITWKLPASHPLNQYSPELAVFFFNYGIEFDLAYSPDSPYKIFPSRYAYFSFDDLYLLGAKIFDKTDPILKEFVATEQDRATKSKEFVPFIDHRPPFIDGDIAKEHILQFGLKIPQKSYYVLGDNHAMSADSRRFGFVPEANLRGVPDLLFWPPGDRFGKPLQVDYPLFVPSRIIVWVLAIIGIILYRYYHFRKGSFPYKF
jgi:signal peptidase I